MTTKNPALDKIRDFVHSQGLELWGVVRLGEERSYPHFAGWIEANKHAGMAFLERHSHCRQDPRQLLPGAKSALILGSSYDLGDSYHHKGGPRIAQYARQRDYHKVLRKKGEKILNFLLESAGSTSPGEEDDAHKTHQGRVLVDSAPVLERALACRGGQGFIGKNTMFIHPENGSFYFLSEILTTLDLESPEAFEPSTLPPLERERSKDGGCGTCRRCQTFCPTGALDQAYMLDANKCISYWTIEHRGTIPEHVWPWLKHYVFGCDICQLVCPYNRKPRQENSKRPKTPLEKIAAEADLPAIALMDQTEYEDTFGGTPLTRAKRGGLMRNALIAMHVTEHPRLREILDLLEKRRDIPEVVSDTIQQITASSAKLAP